MSVDGQNQGHKAKIKREGGDASLRYLAKKNFIELTCTITLNVFFFFERVTYIISAIRAL